MKATCKEYLRTHKKEIILGAAITTISVATALIIQRKIHIKESRKTISKVNEDIIKSGAKSLAEKRLHPDMESAVGIFCDVWNDHGKALAIVTDLKINDMGRLGEELLKIDGVTPDSIIAATLETARYDI